MSKSTLTPEEQYHVACAQVIKQWSSVEMVLWGHLQVFLGLGDQFKVRIIWATLPNLQARRKLLNRFAENYLEGEPLRQYRILMKRLSSLAAKRNMIAHSSHGISEDGKHVIFARFDQDAEDGTFLFIDQQSEQLNNVLQWPAAVSQLFKDLVNYGATLPANIQASAKMHRVQPSDRDRSNDPRQQESTP